MLPHDKYQRTYKKSVDYITPKKDIITPLLKRVRDNFIPDLNIYKKGTAYRQVIEYYNKPEVIRNKILSVDLRILLGILKVYNLCE